MEQGWMVGGNDLRFGQWVGRTVMELPLLLVACWTFVYVYVGRAALRSAIVCVTKSGTIADAFGPEMSAS